MNILDRLADAAAARMRRDMEALPLKEAESLCEAMPKAPPGEAFAFERALEKPGMSFICEVKRASPSKGVIADAFPYMDIARDYAAAGAACVSVLTETDFFLGHDRYLEEIAAAIPLPVLRKDFVTHPYQVYQARLLGAKAVLLICALLDVGRLRALRQLSDSLGVSALVEAHDESELGMAAAAGARVVGVNNRNLRTFEVDLENSARLRGLAPKGTLFVAESGIKSRRDVAALERCGVDAALIGESLMRSPDRRAALRGLMRD
jgi:indole-3-glycerol phosphate synthase